jgi:uridine phosphorylase
VLTRQSYPILEYDPTLEAVIEPRLAIAPIDVARHCVICFFLEVIEKAAAEHSARVMHEDHWEDGVHRLYEMTWNGRRLAFFHPAVGGAQSAALLERAIACGCTTFIACGGAGVLNKEIAVGQLVVPTSAVRDEGASYHYLPPGREVQASPSAVTAIEATLQAHHVPYLSGKTWTTDAPYRETQSKVLLRRSEGCLTVDMEAASFFAVAQFRGVTFGQILYGGDDVSGDDWDRRDWANKRVPVRERLFWLAAEACLRL